MVSEAAPLLFVRQIRFLEDKRRVYIDNAILISSSPTLDLSLDAWCGRISGDHSPQVECKPIVDASQSLWIDAKGNMTCASVDERFCIPVASSGILRIAENSLAFEATGDFNKINPPFFISTSQDIISSRVTVQLELAVDRLNMLADVQVFTTFCLHQYDSEPCRRAVKTFNRRATRMKIGEGSFIPAAISLDGQAVPCVICVREPLSQTFFSKPKKFYAYLYLPSSVSHIPDKAVLFRDVYWQEGNLRQRFHTLIGRVISSETNLSR